MKQPDDPFRDGPLALEQTLLACSDPELTAQMRELAKQGYDTDEPQYFVTARSQQIFRYRELRKQAEAGVIAQFLEGSLVASGYDTRAPIDSPAFDIPPQRWRTLTPDFKNSIATGEGIKIIDIQARR